VGLVSFVSRKWMIYIVTHAQQCLLQALQHAAGSSTGAAKHETHMAQRHGRPAPCCNTASYSASHVEGSLQYLLKDRIWTLPLVHKIACAGHDERSHWIGC